MKSNNNIYIIQYTIYETDISKISNYINGDVETVEDSTSVSIKSVPSGMRNYAGISMIGGKSQKVNQLVADGDGASIDKWQTSSGTLSSSGGVFVLTNVVGREGLVIKQAYRTTIIPDGHKVYMSLYYKSDKALVAYPTPVYYDTNLPAVNVMTHWSYLSNAITGTTAERTVVSNIFGKSSSDTSNFSISNIMIFDVTAMGLDSKTKDELDMIFTNNYIPCGNYILNSSVNSVSSYLIENAELFYNRSYVAATGVIQVNDTRSVTRRIKVPYDKFTLKYNAYSLSGKELLVSVIGYDSDGHEVKSSGWGESAGEYVLSSEWTSVAVLIGNKDVSSMTPGDAQLVWNIDKHELSLDTITSRLPDYGLGISDSICNHIDFSTMKYYHNVASVDISTLSGWGRNTSDGNYFYIGGLQNTKKAGGDNFILASYTNAPMKGAGELLSMECKGHVANGNLFLQNTKYTDDTVLKAASVGEILVYELATPEVIDLKDILPPIRVEAGGTIEFVNKYNLNVPNKVIYKKEV